MAKIVFFFTPLKVDDRIQFNLHEKKKLSFQSASKTIWPGLVRISPVFVVFPVRISFCLPYNRIDIKKHLRQNQSKKKIWLNWIPLEGIIILPWNLFHSFCPSTSRIVCKESIYIAMIFDIYIVSLVLLRMIGCIFFALFGAVSSCVSRFCRLHLCGLISFGWCRAFDCATERSNNHIIGW